MKRILVIDDDAVTRTAAAASLGLVGGYEVLSAAGPEEGLRMARAEAPDGILLDASMPVMDGPEVLAALRRDPATRHIPVVFFTGSARPPDAESWEALGASGAVIKPFDFPGLPAQFERLVGWSRAGEGTA
jgi:CheY-like chemotaxis protein